MKYYTGFEQEKIYHVFARANGRERMFIKNEDYDLFVHLLHKYVMPIADIFAFAFIPNHYHLMIKIKTDNQLLVFAKQKDLNFKESEMWINKLITKQFSNLQNSYCKKINFKYKRKGSLFIERLRRLEIKSDQQFTATVFYIHKNPVHHSIASNIKDWPFSSFHQYLSEVNQFISNEVVLKHFGGKHRFIQFHNRKIVPKNVVEIENDDIHL